MGSRISSRCLVQARICVARKVIDGARKIDKRSEGVIAAAAMPSPGILEHLADEDFGKWKM